MKKEKQKSNEQEEKRSYTFLQKLLYLFVFPLLFLITIVLALLTFQGTNVFDLAKSFIPEKTEVSQSAEDVQNEEPTSPPEEKKSEVSQQVVKLEREINTKQREIAKLIAELEQANNRIKDLETKKEEMNSSTKELASLYERMSTRKAAQIMMELEEEMAVRILTELSVGKKSAILGQLEPKQAARFTKLLASEE